MAIKSYKPTSAGRRFVTVLTNDDLTVGAKPERSLLHDQRHSGGRNNLGRITTRHIGGGNRRKYRNVWRHRSVCTYAGGRRNRTAH